MSEVCAQVIITNGCYADVTALTTAQAREYLFNKGALTINISNYAYSLSGDKKYYGDSLRNIGMSLTDLSISAPGRPLFIPGVLPDRGIYQKSAVHVLSAWYCCVRL